MTRQHASLAAALGAFGLTGLVLFGPLGAAPAAPARAPGMAVDVPAVTAPITAADAHRLPRCANEDGPGPCFWNARTAGNGVGHSFWIGRDFCVHYLSRAAEAKWGDKSTPCLDPYANDRA